MELPKHVIDLLDDIEQGEMVAVTYREGDTELVAKGRYGGPVKNSKGEQCYVVEGSSDARWRIRAEHILSIKRE